MLRVKNVSDAVVTVDAGNGNLLKLQKTSSVVAKAKKIINGSFGPIFYLCFDLNRMHTLLSWFGYSQNSDIINQIPNI